MAFPAMRLRKESIEISANEICKSFLITPVRIGLNDFTFSELLTLKNPTLVNKIAVDEVASTKYPSPVFSLKS